MKEIIFNPVDFKTIVSNSRSVTYSDTGLIFEPNGSCLISVDSVVGVKLYFKRLNGSDGKIIINNIQFLIPPNKEFEIKISINNISILKDSNTIGKILLTKIIGLDFKSDCDWNVIIKSIGESKGLKVSDQCLTASEYAVIVNGDNVEYLETFPFNCYKREFGKIKFLYNCKIIDIKLKNQFYKPELLKSFGIEPIKIDEVITITSNYTINKNINTNIVNDKYDLSNYLLQRKIDKNNNLIEASKEELYFLTALSIGELIIIQSSLSNILDKYSKINLLPYYSYSSYPGEKEFVKSFCKTIFTNNKYCLLDSPILGKVEYPKNKEDFSSLLWIGGLMKRNIKLVEPYLVSELVNNEKPEYSNYVVLNTKVRILKKRTFLNNLIEFKKMLLEISKNYTIIIMGEKSNQKNHNDENIFCCYDYIKDIFNDKFIDLTFEIDPNNRFSNIENLKKDCTIMHYSKLVISFGVGGSFVLASSVANKTIALVDLNKEELSKLNEIYKNSNRTSYFTNEFVFIKRVKDFLNIKG